MFYNQTNLANISHHFTYEFTKLMYDLKDLEVKPASSKTADAYLVGILRPYLNKHTVLDRGLSREAGDRFPTNASGQELLVPVTTYVNLQLDLYLVRRSPETMGFIYELRGQNFPELLKGNPAILLNETLYLRPAFARETFDGEAAVVNSTQNRGIIQKIMSQQAMDSASHFREKILYAF